MPIRFAALLFAVLFATAAPAAKVFKWTDDDGQVHYGAQPPQGVEAEPLNVEAARSEASRTPGTQEPPETAAAEQPAEPAGDPADTEGQVDTEFVNEQCRLARSNLKSLEQGGPSGRYVNDDDEIVRYSEEQYQARVQENQRFIDRFCKE